MTHKPSEQVEEQGTDVAVMRLKARKTKVETDGHWSVFQQDLI